MRAHTEHSDILIVGGGAVGLCAAYFLHEKGCRVTVLEKGVPGGGSSYGNAGLVVPSHFVPLAAPGAISQGLKWIWNPESPFYIKPRFDLALFDWLWKFRAACNAAHVQRSATLLRDLNLGGKRLYEQFSQQAGFNFGFTPKGLMILFRSPAGAHECGEMAAAAGDLGLSARIVSNEEIAQIDPALHSRAQGAVYFQDDAHLDPAAFNRAMHAYLETAGVAVQSGCEVLGFQKSGRKITAVKTSRGDYSAGEILLAGGAWTAGIARQLGLKLPMQAGKGYSITLPYPDAKPSIPLILEEARVAVTPLGDRLRLAGTLELSGLDASINHRRVKAILRALSAYIDLPRPINPDQAEIWAGLRPCTPDGLPYLGRTARYGNLSVAAGHAMIGMSTAPSSGKLISEVIVGEEPFLDISLLDVDRYV